MLHFTGEGAHLLWVLIVVGGMFHQVLKLSGLTLTQEGLHHFLRVFVPLEGLCCVQKRGVVRLAMVETLFRTCHKFLAQLWDLLLIRIVGRVMGSRIKIKLFTPFTIYLGARMKIYHPSV
jgi:hypothetical protein